jgi:hypothetical protein
MQEQGALNEFWRQNTSAPHITSCLDFQRIRSQNLQSSGILNSTPFNLLDYP